MSKSTTKCPHPGYEPGPLDPELDERTNRDATDRASHSENEKFIFVT